MAKTQSKPKETALSLEAPKGKGRMPLVLAILGAVAGLFLLLLVLHMSGVLNGPEEALYQRFADNKTMSVLLRPLHHPDFKKTLTTEEALDVIQLRREMRKAADIIEGQKETISALEKKVGKLEKSAGQMDKIAKDMKTLKESGAEVTPEAIMAALEGAPAGGAAAAPAAGAPPALPAVPQGQSLLSAFQARDYRKVTKIIEGMPAEQSADVLDALSMQDETFVIEVLATLKEDTAAEILQNFEPGKTGELLQKIASRRQSGT